MPLFVVATAVACASDRAPEFAGEYRSEPGRSYCEHDHPEAAGFSAIWYMADPFVIERRDDDVFALSVPLPPCAIEGRVVDDELLLDAPDCSEDFAAAPQLDIEAHSVTYADVHGVARWEAGVLVIALESGRQYSRVLGNLPDWWDDPGSCHAEYRMSPIE